MQNLLVKRIVAKVSRENSDHRFELRRVVSAEVTSSTSRVI